MDSINSYTTANLPPLKAERPACPPARGEAEKIEVTLQDTCELSTDNQAKQDKKHIGVFKSFLRQTKELYKEASDSPITFIKDHKKVVPAAAGAVAAGAALTAAVLLDAGKADDAADIAQLAIFKGGVKGKIELYSKIAETTGLAAGAACLIGGGVTAAVGLVKAGRGVVKIAKGIKKHDPAAAAKGARTTVAGVRKALTGAVVGAMNAGGIPGVAAKVTRSVIMPPLRKAAAGLNIGIGTHTLVKGLQHKNKKEIVTGALDLGYGTAVAASIIVGGPAASVACTALLFAKEAFSVGKNIAKLVNKDKNIQKERRAEQADQKQNGKKAPEVKETRPQRAVSSPDRAEELSARQPDNNP